MPDNRFLPAFHFTVQCSGLKGNTETDTGFESVTGLKITAAGNDGTAPVTEDKKLPALFNPIVLKRAVSRQHKSPLRQWVLKSLNGSKTTPLPEILVQVLDEEHRPAITFRLTQVTAAGWQLGELNAQQNGLLMEEITLHYRSVELLTD